MYYLCHSDPWLFTIRRRVARTLSVPWLVRPPCVKRGQHTPWRPPRPFSATRMQQCVTSIRPSVAITAPRLQETAQVSQSWIPTVGQHSCGHDDSKVPFARLKGPGGYTNALQATNMYAAPWNLEVFLGYAVGARYTPFCME